VKIRVEEEACVGHGRCYALAPLIFEADDYGHCVVVKAEVGADLEGAARQAADNCPESAITLEDE
jgi:ferredoxin